MKLRLLLASVLLISLSCTAGVVPRVSSIQVVYVGSIWEDIYREKPISAGVAEIEGIKVTHTLTDPVFMEYFLLRMGLNRLLDSLGLDFVVGDTVAYGSEYFPIQKTLGYGIKNIGGIRFAMVCSPEESLTVKDQISISLLKERSDILWVIDKPLLAMPPSLIAFNMSQRTLSDTSVSKIRVKDNAERTRLIHDFRQRVENELNREIRIAGRIDEHVFSVIAQREDIDVIIYPERLFTENGEAVSMNLRTLMESVAFEMKFSKTEMTPSEISEIVQNNGFLNWGKIKEKSIVLLRDEAKGNHIFDYYYERKLNED